MSDAPPATGIGRLLDIMARLRDPQGGCPWDLEQDFASIAPYTIEEAYEVAEAIARGDLADLTDELGDLLLQVVFHAQMARERGAFEFQDVVDAICEKMIRRHPHVFEDGVEVESAEHQTAAWEAIKREERRARGTADDSLMDGVGRGLPPALRATALQRRARRARFDWSDAAGPLAKLEEELGEMREAAASGNQADIEAEMGDLLFTCANIARHLGVDTEVALAGANARFEQRFRAMEVLARAGGEALAALDDEAREQLWQRAKQAVAP